MGPEVIAENRVLIILARRQRGKVLAQFLSRSLEALHHDLSDIFAGGIHDEKRPASSTPPCQRGFCFR